LSYKDKSPRKGIFFMVKNNKLFIGEISAEDLVAKYGSPLYVYDADSIKRQYRNLVKNITYKKLKIHFASKANTNIEILKLLREQGCAIDTVSPGEVLAAEKAEYKKDEINITSSN